MAEPDVEMLTPEDLRKWHRREIEDLTKAMELRLKDAADFVEGYSSSRLSAEEANARFHNYSNRWGESPLEGIGSLDKMTNSGILERIDETRRRSGSRRR